MQDRFKFRTWDKKHKIMVYCVEESTPEQIDKFKGIYYNDEYYYCREVVRLSCLYDIDDNFIVEQCSGLKDKNGKLIYEGDIIELTRARNYGYIPRGTKLVIEWNTFDCCGFSTGVRGNLTKKCADNCIVIGNIHENPDLLGDKADDRPREN